MHEHGGTVETYRRHLVDDVLAWWMANAPDHEHGGIMTCWDNRGSSLVSTDKYTWSQGRWAWLTARVAEAAARGLLDVDAEVYLEQSVTTATFVRDHALLPDARTAYVTDRAGTPREPRAGGGLATSVFADLFAALGMAGVARLRPADDWGGIAEEILLRAAATIADGKAPADPYPVPQGHLSFAFPMILIGVGEQVHRVTGSAASADLVRECAADVAGKFTDGRGIVEMPATDPGRNGSLIARHRTPGHALEALWFLHHARDLIAGTGLDDSRALLPAALRACELGWDPVHGGLLRFADEDGGEPRGSRTDHPYEALVVDTWDTKLWWPHAEALYTTTLLASETGEASVAEWARRIHDYTFATFPEGAGREWTQIRTRAGDPLEKTVGLPVKDPFHVTRALLMLVEHMSADQGDPEAAPK